MGENAIALAKDRRKNLSYGAIKKGRSTGSIVALTGVRISKKTARRSTLSVIVRWLDLAHGTVVAGATYPVSIRFTYHSTSRSRAVEGVNSGRFTPSTAYVATASSCKRSTINPEDPLFLDVVYRRQIRRAAMAISAHPLEKFRTPICARNF